MSGVFWLLSGFVFVHGALALSDLETAAIKV